MALHEPERLEASDEEVRRVAVAALAGLPLAQTLPFIFRAMGDPSWRVRKEAVETLFSGGLAGAEVVQGLIGLLRSSDNAGLRNCAVESLERLGSAAVEPLCAQLSDPDPDLRKFAIDILGSIRATSCVPLLVKALEDADPNVSVAAAENLGKIGDPAALPHLISVLREGDLWLKFSVLDALAAIGAPVPLELLAPLLSEPLLKRAVYDCLGAVGGEDAAPLLLEGLQQRTRNAREAAAVALMRLRGRLQPRQVLTFIDLPLKELRGSCGINGLMHSLDGVEHRVLEALVILLGIIGDERCTERLVEVALEERLRARCAEALMRLGTGCLPQLTRLFAVADQQQRAFIAFLLGELGGEQSVPLLLEALAEENAALRAACLVALGRLGGGAVAPELARFVSDEDPEVRRGALQALEQLAPVDPGAVAGIAAELSVCASASRRRDAAGLLGRLADTERLARLAKDEDPGVRHGAVAALGRTRLPQGRGHLVMALMDEEPEVRMAAAAALGEVGGEEAREALLLSLRDGDPRVQAACLKALGALKDRSALPAVAAVAADARGLVLIQALKSLAALGGAEALLPVRQALFDPDEEVVVAAIEVLAASDDGWIRECGETLAAHPHWGVRRALFRAAAPLAEELPWLTQAHQREKDPLVKGELEQVIGRLG